MTTISCVIATYGSRTWANMAKNRAIPSAKREGFHEVLPVHLEQGTLAETRNSGGATAVGEWLLFLDADDELAPGFGDAMREAILGEEVRPALFTPAVDYLETRKGRKATPKTWPRIDFKVGNWCVIGTLIERDFFLKLGGFREYGLYEDYALFAMADEAGAEFFEVPDAVYVAHPRAASRNRAPSRNERIYWHQTIGHDIWPDHFTDVTPEEHANRALSRPYLRFV